MTHDRFAVRLATMLRPRFSEVYFFETSIWTMASGGRIAGFEMWVDERLVIGEGKTTGQIAL